LGGYAKWQRRGWDLCVDLYTGDVFSAIMSCKEEKNKNLAAFQKRVRSSLHLTEAEYQKMKTKGPLCEE
jgi:hypothetical protein